MGAPLKSQLPNLLERQVGAIAHRKEMAEQQQQQQPIVIAMFNVAMIGHVNPTYALVQELVQQRGCRVHYFLPPNEDIRAAAREAGATVEGYMPGDPQDLDLQNYGDLDGLKPMEKYSVWPLASTFACSEYIVSRCRELATRIVVYDPMAPHGLLVAKALRIPCVSLVTYPGLGVFTEVLTDEYIERSRFLRQSMAKEVAEVESFFDVNLNTLLDTRLQWLADENFVTTSEELHAPLPKPGLASWADECRDLFKFSCVGCMSNSLAPHVTTSNPTKASETKTSSSISNQIPTAELQAASDRGVRLIYVALGTMALAERWSIDLGDSSGGNLPVGCTGKSFCQYVWQAVFAAMRDLGNDYLCVLCVGHQEDALDFLEGRSEDERLAQIPANVIVRTSVQQVTILSSFVHAFVTHAGFNSLQESLIAGVPLIAVPQAVDQPGNARSIESQGWGRAFLEPMRTLTSSALTAALRDVASDACPYREAVAKAGAALRGGEVRAADRLLDMCDL